MLICSEVVVLDLFSKDSIWDKWSNEDTSKRELKESISWN
jgi:hypothetical protein